MTIWQLTHEHKNCHCDNFGKIQGDGRKFLDHFKSYFGSQISSQSLNEIHIYWLQPKSATKGELFSYIFVFDCQFESVHIALWCLKGNKVNASLVPTLARQLYSRLNILRLQFFSVHFPCFFYCRSLFNKAADLAALCRLRSSFAICDSDTNSKQSKTKIYGKKSSFVADFSCNW